MNVAAAGRSLSRRMSVPVLLLVVFGCLPGRIFAVDIAVTCGDVSDTSTCALAGTGSFTSELFDNVSEVLDTLQTGSAQGRCRLLEANVGGADGVGSYGCTVLQNGEIAVDLICRIGNGEATCEYPNAPELIDMSCTQDGQAGTCDITTSAEAIGELSTRIGVPRQLSPLANALIEGCASFAGSPALRRDCAPLLNDLTADDGDPANVVSTLQEIAPQNSDSALYSTQITVTSRLDHVFRRLQRRRARRPIVPGLNVDDLQVFEGRRRLRPIGLSATDSLDPIAGLAPEVDAGFGRLGLFVSGSLVDARHVDDARENGSDESSQLLTWGFDYRLTPQWVAGIVFSGAATRIDYDNGRGDLKDLGLLLTAYAGYFKSGLYIDAGLGVGGNEYVQDRRIRCTVERCGADFDQRASSRFNGTQLALALSGGYDIVRDALTVTPYAQLIATAVTIDSYRETASSPTAAGAGFVFDLDEQSRSSATIGLGGKATYTVGTAYGVLVPELGVELVTELNRDDLVVEGSFIGNISDDDDFRLETRAVDGSYAVLSGGTQLLLARGNSVYANGRYVLGNDRVDLFQLTGGLRLEWQ